MYDHVSLDPPVHVCVVCRLSEEHCNGEIPGAHIYDGIDCKWAVVDHEAEQIVSIHLTRTEAAKAAAVGVEED